MQPHDVGLISSIATLNHPLPTSPKCSCHLRFGFRFDCQFFGVTHNLLSQSLLETSIGALGSMSDLFSGEAWRIENTGKIQGHKLNWNPPQAAFEERNRHFDNLRISLGECAHMRMGSQP